MHKFPKTGVALRLYQDMSTLAHTQAQVHMHASAKQPRELCFQLSVMMRAKY